MHFIVTTSPRLRRQTPASHHVERLQSQLSQLGADTANSPALIGLNMALAKEYEDLADYPKAFEHLVRGKSAGANPDYSIRQDEVLFAAIADTFSAPRDLDLAAGCPTDEPIFIIGMPRSGTPWSSASFQAIPMCIPQGNC